MENENQSIDVESNENTEVRKLPPEELASIQKQLNEYDIDLTSQQLTELVETGNIISPTSLTFWSQPKTAENSPYVVEIPADSYGTVVRAQITSPDGGKIKISYFDCQIEATIAQLVMENGVPLVVTPAQVYRKFASMPNDERVTKKMEQEVLNSFDKLLVTPATLDFTQEIQNHSKLKRNRNFDYKNTVIHGTLITGVHVSSTTVTASNPEDISARVQKYYYKGREMKNVMIIFSMPLYAIHDQMVNQIMTVKSSLINSPDGVGHSVALPDKREPTNATHVIAMRRYIVLQVNRMIKNRTNGRNAYKYTEQSKNQEQRKDRLTFNTIAEHADITLTPRSMRTLRSNTERILNELITEKMITGYSLYKRGRAYEGVEIYW